MSRQVTKRRPLTKNKNISNRPATGRPTSHSRFPSTPGQPERKRSIVRTLVMSGVGGIFGLALGYYALLWLGPVFHRGKEIDFLDVAHYLPKAVLPSVFRTEVKQPPALPPSKMAADIAASEKDVKQEPAKKLSQSRRPLRATQRRKAARSRREASGVYQPVAPPAKKSADPDDRYAIPAAKSEPAMREPAPLDTRRPRRSPRTLRKSNQFA